MFDLCPVAWLLDGTRMLIYPAAKSAICKLALKFQTDTLLISDRWQDTGFERPS